jgi:hypothetical protein
MTPPNTPRPGELSTPTAVEGLLTGPAPRTPGGGIEDKPAGYDARRAADLSAPRIPVSPASRTGSFKVELSPDQQAVRVGALLDGRTVVVGRRNSVIHDLDPTEALWLATQLRAHALTIIEEGRPVGPYAPTRNGDDR